MPVPTSGNCPLGPPPGRKRHISFQPISHPQTPIASPFVSPRTTPVPTMRSRHCSSGATLPLHLLPGGSRSSGYQNFNSGASDISLAGTFGSESECSTPFISPHGTPIHFNRSRHSSAQGRLCRSRHSSGIAGPFSGNSMKGYAPFCPVAFTNLNNPYSPQPTTPYVNYQDQVTFCLEQILKIIPTLYILFY